MKFLATPVNINFVEIITIIVFNLILFGRTINYGLVIDDIERYRHLYDSKYKGFSTTISESGLISWILFRLYGGGTFSNNTKLDHAFTLFLHIITCCLIAIAFNPITAILYSAHPVNNQTSIWLNGRRYSLAVITFLILVITKTLFLLPVLAIPLILFIRQQYDYRKQLARPPLTKQSVLNAIRHSLHKISGLYKPSFLYPYENTASYIPFSQPVAERYLVIPTILFLSLVSKTKLSLLLLLPYSLLSLSLQPMYINIQSFYDFHSSRYPSLKKLSLLKILYPEIKT